MAKPVVDIEFAHLDMAPLDVAIEEQEVAESGVLARHLIESLNHAHVTWTTSVLIDDKRVEGRSYDVDVALQRVARLIGPVPVHRALMERCLSELKSEFIALFDRRRGSAIEADFHRYQINRDGRLGCSQDIAVWSAVRLGLIPASVVCDRIPSSARFGFSRDSNPDLLVSVLPERYRTYEDRAAHQFLRLLDSGSVLLRSINLYFAPTSERRVPSASIQVGDVVKKIGERLAQLNPESR